MDERFREALKNLWRAALSTSPQDAMGGEWTVPVRPSDLRLILECLDEDYDWDIKMPRVEIPRTD